MRLILEIILGFVLCVILAAAAMAQEPVDLNVRRAQIAAATSSAVDALRGEVYTVSLSRGVTVRDLVEKTGSQTDLNQILQRSEQIGGPRWLDAQTCQVRLEITGQRIAPVLIQMANIAHERTPIKTSDLQSRLDDFSRRTFCATGSSTGAATVETIQPAVTDAAWSNVPEATRRTAVNSARHNAIDRVIDSLRPIEIAPRRTIASELDAPNSVLKQSLTAYLNNRPVSAVRFREDKQVELTMSVPPAELYEVIRGVLAQPNGAGSNFSAQDWQHLHDQVIGRAANPVGTAPISAAVVLTPGSRIPIPARAPDWADHQITAEATGRDISNPLRARNQACDNAVRKLKSQLDGLRLTPQLTIADAAKQDAQIADALNRTLSRVRPYKLDSEPNGSVTAKVSLDLADVWTELQNVPQ